MHYALVFLAIELTVIVIAALAGDRPERLGAAILTVMVAITFSAYAFLPGIYNTVDPVALAVDLIGLAGFSYLGITTRRVWPLWAASLQVLSTGAHFVRALEIPIKPAVYFFMKMLPTIGVFMLVLLGAVAYRWRLHQVGARLRAALMRK